MMHGSTNYLRKFWPGILLLLFILTGFYGPSVANGNEEVQYNISLDRTNIPDLNYDDISLEVNVGDVSIVNVIEDQTNLLAYQYDAQTGIIKFTTSGDLVTLTLTGPNAALINGQINIQPLKNDARFAWSHGMDDNVFLDNSIAVFDSYNYRGTIYTIANVIDDTRDEDWIVDKIDLHALLANGWSLGNHTYAHGCYGVNYEQEILDGYDRLLEIVADSPTPGYLINSFAAPCFDSNYHPFILQHRDNGTTATVFNESGNDSLLAVEPNATAYTSAGKTATAFDFDLAIGRAHAIELGNTSEATGMLDWMAANSTGTHRFWYNTYSHGGKENAISTVMGYADTNYGSSGSNSIWIAPAEEIYAYLLIRENIGLSISQGTGDPIVPATATPIPTATIAPPTPTPPPVSADEVVYDDIIDSDWNAGSWGSISIQQNISDPVYAGSASLGMTYLSQWTTMYIERGQPIPTSNHEQLSFWMIGSPEGDTTFRVALMDTGYQTSTKLTYTATAGNWQLVQIPLAAFSGVSDIRFIIFENPTSTSQPTVYFDNIQFGDEVPIPPTPTPTVVPTNTPPPTATATAEPTNTPSPTATATTAPPSPSLKLETVDLTSVDSSWQTVTLQHTYSSMVAVCTVYYANNSSPVLARMQNAGGNQFEVKLQNPGDSATVVGDRVSCLVIEEGAWTLPNGTAIEAQTYVSSRVDEDNSWVGEAQTYQNSYTTPVVLGQVMTNNNPEWSAFWSRGSGRGAPPNASTLFTGMHVGGDSNNTRTSETIGFIVIESGSGTLDGVEYHALLGSDNVRGVTNNGNYTYSFSPAFSAPIAGAVSSQAAMDGTDGSWAVINAEAGLTASSVTLFVDEDQIRDSERNHTTEQLYLFAFADGLIYPNTNPTPTATPTTAPTNTPEPT
ncbi:MAG: hypothetical protein AAF633_24140, partial [Chloroflexota bacterium]